MNLSLRWLCLLRALAGKRPKGASGRSVSRILSSEFARFTPRRRHPCSLAWAIISLGSLPDTQVERAAPSSLFDLAPDGGCLAAHIAVDAGGLLHHLFIMTGSGARRRLARLFFSVARSDRSLRPGISPASCPVEYGLSSTLRGGEPRSPDRPEADASYTVGWRASTPPHGLPHLPQSAPSPDCWQAILAGIGAQAHLSFKRSGRATKMRRSFNVK